MAELKSFVAASDAPLIVSSIRREKGFLCMDGCSIGSWYIQGFRHRMVNIDGRSVNRKAHSTTVKKIAGLF